MMIILIIRIQNWSFQYIADLMFLQNLTTRKITPVITNWEVFVSE